MVDLRLFRIVCDRIISHRTAVAGTWNVSATNIYISVRPKWRSECAGGSPGDRRAGPSRAGPGRADASAPSKAASCGQSRRRCGWIIHRAPVRPHRTIRHRSQLVELACYRTSIMQLEPLPPVFSLYYSTSLPWPQNTVAHSRPQNKNCPRQLFTSRFLKVDSILTLIMQPPAISSRRYRFVSQVTESYGRRSWRCRYRTILYDRLLTPQSVMPRSCLTSIMQLKPVLSLQRIVSVYSVDRRVSWRIRRSEEVPYFPPWLVELDSDVNNATAAGSTVRIARSTEGRSPDAYMSGARGLRPFQALRPSSDIVAPTSWGRSLSRSVGGFC